MPFWWCSAVPAAMLLVKSTDQNTMYPSLGIIRLSRRGVLHRNGHEAEQTCVYVQFRARVVARTKRLWQNPI